MLNIIAGESSLKKETRTSRKRNKSNRGLLISEIYLQPQLRGKLDSNKSKAKDVQTYKIDLT